MLFSEQQYRHISQGDLETLVGLDRRGFLLGPDETLEDYARRLQTLEANLAELEDELAATGRVEIDGLTLPAADRIPPEIFAESRQMTRQLFGFAIDWVPGFFVDPSFSWLFGGCAFSYYPDFLALFIIRRSFASKPRWLIYRRDELLSHELCHVARIAMESRIYEETFAYQTATSRFRRLAGSLFRTPADSFLLLGSTMLLLVAQIIRVFVYPPMPIVWFWGWLGGVLAFLLVRHCRAGRLFNRAVRAFEAIYPGRGLAMAFRCSDSEVMEIGKMRGRGAPESWLREKTASSVRWKVILASAGANVDQ